MRIPIPPYKVLLHEPLKVLSDPRHEDTIIDIVIPQLGILQETALCPAQNDTLIPCTGDTFPACPSNHIVDITGSMSEAECVRYGASGAAFRVGRGGRDGASGTADGDDEVSELGQEGRSECVGSDDNGGGSDTAASCLYSPATTMGLFETSDGGVGLKVHAFLQTQLDHFASAAITQRHP